MSRSTGMGHRDHPWLKMEVLDQESGRRGILRAIAPEGEKGPPVAWLAPVDGGTEWTTHPNSLGIANPATPAAPGETPDSP